MQRGSKATTAGRRRASLPSRPTRNGHSGAAASLSSCSTANCGRPSAAPRSTGSTVAANSSSSLRLRRSSHRQLRPVSSASGRRFCASTRLTASRSGSRLPAVLLAARFRPRAAGQSAGARTHGDRDATRPRRYRRRASPARSGCADCSSLPRESSPECRNRDGPGEVRRLGRIRALAWDHLLRHDRCAVDQLADALDRAGIPVVRYHGKMHADDRAAAQRRLMHPPNV